MNKINEKINKTNKCEKIKEIQYKFREAYLEYMNKETLSEEEEKAISMMLEKAGPLADKLEELKAEIHKTGEEIANEIIINAKNSYSLSKLKKDAENKSIKLETVYNYAFDGKINKKIRGVRKIGQTSSTGFYLINEEGDKSWLEYPKSAYKHYDDDYLVILSEYNNKVMFIYKVIR